MRQITYSLIPCFPHDIVLARIRNPVSISRMIHQKLISLGNDYEFIIDSCSELYYLVV